MRSNRPQCLTANEFRRPDAIPSRVRRIAFLLFERIHHSGRDLGARRHG
jgi:hypothetical protein